MENQKESIEILLINRIYLYELMHVVFGREPDEKLMETLSSEAAIQAFALLSEDEDDLMHRMSEFAGEQKTRMEADSEYMHSIKSEYTKLFIGPGNLVACPWESTYNGRGNQLFQESTLRVRQAYRKYGYLPVDYLHVADDHIALELHFMVKLSEKVLDAFRVGNMGETIQILKDQKIFLKDHMLNWVPKYAENLKRSPTAYLYPPFGQAVNNFIHIDDELIAEVLETLVHNSIRPGEVGNWT